MDDRNKWIGSALAVSSALLFMGGCSRTEDKQLTVDKVTYKFPARQVQSFTEPGEGMPFARVRPRGQLFDLIYGNHVKYRTNKQGGNTPLVLSVNDHSSAHFERFDFDGFVAVCRGDQPYFACGMLIEDAGVPWSVVFNRDQLADAASIRASALAALQDYRV